MEAQLCEEGAFCDRDRDGFFKDHKRCVGIELCADPGVVLDFDDNNCEIPDPDGCGDEDTTTSKESFDLIMTFDDVEVD